jgi:hypothetical protein
MPVVAGAMPGLVHVFPSCIPCGINTTVGISAIVPITISGLLYIFTMFAPIIYPQSSNQNTFSGLLWYLVQRVHGRRGKDRASSGALKTLSPNMAEGQM